MAPDDPQSWTGLGTCSHVEPASPAPQALCCLPAALTRKWGRLATRPESASQTRGAAERDGGRERPAVVRAGWAPTLMDSNVRGGGHKRPLMVSAGSFSKPTGLRVNLKFAGPLGDKGSCWLGLMAALLPQTTH